MLHCLKFQEHSKNSKRIRKFLKS